MGRHQFRYFALYEAEYTADHDLIVFLICRFLKTFFYEYL